MAQEDRKALIRGYKETPRPAGVFRVRNSISGKSLIGATTDLPGKINSYRFQLEHGSHPSRDLQSDWKALGAEAFTFEVLDQLKPSERPDYKANEDLMVLKALWQERLKASGESMYRELG
ncbi:MAG: GIY-YIG nuclease family protein [Thermodesulfobacteriota bacterium]